MLHTSIIVELLRSQPRLTFWVATLAQAGLWWMVPSLLYSSPPGDLPLVLAIGHEFQLGSSFGPPLAFWVAEVAYDIAGSPGVYLLAQACIVFAYYGVFTLARAIVGTHHATFAILLMVGISAFTAPTPNFGPAILAMPFTVFAIVNLWRAVGERRRSRLVPAGAATRPAAADHLCGPRSGLRRSWCFWRRRGAGAGRCDPPIPGLPASWWWWCCFPI